MHTEPVKNLSGPHQVFAEGIAKGLNQTEAYLAAYPGSKPAAARANAARLIAKDSITAEIDNIRRKAEQIGGSALMTLLERRKILAEIGRSEARDCDRISAVKLDHELEGNRLGDELTIHVRIGGDVPAAQGMEGS